MQEKQQTRSTGIPTEDSTLLYPIYAKNGMKSRLYYFFGNFFQPVDLHKKSLNKVKIAKFQFMRENAELIKKDRAHPEYKTLIELFDEQFEGELK